MSEQSRGTIAIPEADLQIPPTPREEIDKVVAAVRAQKGVWPQISVEERLALVERVRADTRAVAEDWASSELAAKRIDPEDPAASEGWMTGPVILLRNLRQLRDVLTDIRDDGKPQLPGEATTRADGQVVVPVFPATTYDRLLFAGVTAEVRLEHGTTLADLEEQVGLVYRDANDEEGEVAFVLGAGNVSAIPAMDSLSKLFVENQVVVMKMNPVNEHVGPILERAFAALIERDLLRIVYGGADVGSYLVDHDGIDAVHMTGSDKTFEAIVFGPGEEGQRRKEERRPELTKPITAELGNVTPVIVVPGPWSDGDIAYHGENIATMLTNNVGFNCIAVRAIVTHGSWARRRDLLDSIRGFLRQAGRRHAYYPGAADRMERFLDGHPEAEKYGTADDGALPWTLVPDVPARSQDEILFEAECFTPVTAEVPLDAPRDVAAFVDAAVEFCNERLWGTLGATIIIHPRQLKDPEIAAAFDRALANLRYGTVCVNHWSGVAYVLGTTPWGAFPGHDVADIQSGIGKVHNLLMLPRTEKAVLRAPFRVRPKPVWFVTHRRGGEVARKIGDLEADGSPRHLPEILWAASRP
ncbi:MAG: aldehyde dehydrogenase family protein [Nitriliruptorales bacterium]